MTQKKRRLETQVLHAGHVPDSATGSRAVPIYQTSSFVFRDVGHAADLFALREQGHIYTRLTNPTTEVLEKRLAAMHGASAVLATASGMSAVFYAVAAITSAGRNFVSGTSLYGGTHTLFSHTLPRFGIEVRFTDASNPAEMAAAVDENTRLVYTEAIGNPRCNVDDLEAIAAVAHDNGIPFVLDATTAPPPIFDPLAVGADIVVYSLTKILSGHGTVIGGAVVEAGGFDWAASGKFPEIVEFDGSFTTCLRAGLARDVGACPAPMSSFQVIQGLETLPLRARAHCANARAVAEFLAGHQAVEWVNYAGLPDHPDHQRAAKYFPLGPGAVFGFGIRGGYEAGRRFIESVKLCSHLANILDARTLVIHPASTTHSQISPEDQLKAGVTPDMVRISVGIEHVDDILADLDQALEASQK